MPPISSNQKIKPTALVIQLPVKIVKMRGGFPISEEVFAFNLSQKVVVDYISSEFVYDKPLALYQAFVAIEKVNEFFLLGCFYMIKGFLEDIYKNMNTRHNIPEDLLKAFFKDDFFFKKDNEFE